MTKLFSVVLSGFAIAVTVTPARATSVVFAGFNQTSGAQDFVLTSTASGSQDQFNVTINGSASINFTYLIGGTQFGSTPQVAQLQFTVTSALTGHCDLSHASCQTPGATYTEFGFSGSFTITRDTPMGGLSNLLSGTFNVLPSGGELSSAIGAGSATLEATGTSSNPDQVVFTSDFLNFAKTMDRDATFNLSSLTSLVPPATGFSVIFNTASNSRFPDNFSAFGSGFFADAVEVPEPSTFVLPVSGLLAFCLWQRKRRLPHR